MPLAPGQRARFDVNNYRIIAELNPAQNLLTATADVTFTPLDNTRSVVFELNGSLKVNVVGSYPMYAARWFPFHRYALALRQRLHANRRLFHVNKSPRPPLRGNRLASL